MLLLTPNYFAVAFNSMWFALNVANREVTIMKLIPLVLPVLGLAAGVAYYYEKHAIMTIAVMVISVPCELILLFFFHSLFFG